MNGFDLLPPLAAAAAGVALLPRLKRRLELSAAKHPSLAGHSRLAKRIARLVPFYALEGDDFFSADGAPAGIRSMRAAALGELAATYARRFARTSEQTRVASASISDLQFTGRYRVPFQFRQTVMEALPSGGFVQSSSGVVLLDLDGNSFYDLTGSYGVNVFGHDFYKACIAEGAARVARLGPVLGACHPCVGSNAERLKQISGLDEVSFHMSGTEAVMQAVRLARYHTGRTHLVRFCGAYHGWWDDVQPGVGTPVDPALTYTLMDMHERSLKVLGSRNDIACVLVNPLQALHPNGSAPSDGALVDSSRRAHFDREAYAAWLRSLRKVCDERGIVLIFDEVFVGFRLAPGGAQQYFGVRADLVTYGKTLGGGLPVGVLCGKRALMRRWRDERPADVCFARGTFNAHPYVMGAMQVFLERLDTAEVRAAYEGLDERWDRRAASLNARLADAEVPVRVANLSTIWSVTYTLPSRYNWMLQYYLRAEGLALSWVGTGRLIFSFDYSDADFDQVTRRFVAACQNMKAAGWWWQDAGLTHRTIRRRVLLEVVRRRLGLGSRPIPPAREAPAPPQVHAR